MITFFKLRGENGKFYVREAHLLLHIYLKVLAKICMYFYTASMEYLHNVCNDIVGST